MKILSYLPYLTALFFMIMLLWSYSFLPEQMISPMGTVHRTYYFYAALGSFVFLRAMALLLGYLARALDRGQGWRVGGEKITIPYFMSCFVLFLDLFIAFFLLLVSFFFAGRYAYMGLYEGVLYAMMGGVFFSGLGVLWLTFIGFRQTYAARA